MLLTGGKQLQLQEPEMVFLLFLLWVFVTQGTSSTTLSIICSCL
jgi:hypothetical protein